MEILFGIIAIILAGGLGYFLALQKSKDISTQNAVLESEKLLTNERLNELKTSLAKENGDKQNYKEELIESQTENKNLKEKLETQVLESENIHKKHLEQFENLSNRIVKDNSAQFREMSAETLQNVLSPLKEKMSSFENKVQETYEKQLKDNTSLKEQITTLADMSKQIGQDAVNLTNALKGDKKIQGNWGEILLETLLEKSGLEKEVQYKTQVTLSHDNGDVRRPDVVIYLPDNKNLVIDSKVSLNAYSEYCSSEDTIIQKEKYQEHVSAIKSHIKILSEKKYEQLLGINTPDYVLMFVPLEPAFTLAMQDPALFHFALERNIVLVTSSTLLATLRTVASIWKQESQQKHVLEIASESGKLYDKFVGFIEDMTSIGDTMDKTRKSYDAAMNKLTDGTGNIISRFERMKKLGAKASKTIDANLLNEINE
jgi:DNA recombination protein RmuC